MIIDDINMEITNNDDLRDKIHEIHNYMRNNGTKKTGIHHQRYDPTIYSFLNVKTGEQLTALV